MKVKSSEDLGFRGSKEYIVLYLQKASRCIT